MKKFTYLDYIKAIHILKTNETLKFEEEGTEYKIKKVKTKEDRVIEILRDKKEMAEFLNNFFNFKNEIKQEELIEVKNNFVEKQSKGKNNNIIYKQIDSEVFFLVQHETSIDKELSYCMLNFCTEILQEWARNKKAKFTAKKPVVIPIVIYTGKEKIKKQKPATFKKIGNYTFENFEMNFEYNLINIKNIAKQHLIEQDTVFSYSMILEKSKDEAKQKMNLQMLESIIKDDKKLEKIKKIYTN